MCVAVCYSVLQCVAVCCSVLQCVAADLCDLPDHFEMAALAMACGSAVDKLHVQISTCFCHYTLTVELTICNKLLTICNE